MSRKNNFSFKTEKQRQKIKTKRFFIGFISFLLVFACFSILYLLITYDFDLSSKFNARETETTEQEAASAEYNFSGDMKHLLIFCTDSEVKKMRFLSVVRVDLENNEFTICSMSENERINVNGINETFMNHYLLGGAKELVEAVEAFNGIKIDRYISSDEAGFKRAINSAGQLKLKLDEQINFREGDFSIVMIEGEQKMRGEETLRYLRYCDLIGDRGLTMQSEFIGSMLNQYITEANIEKGNKLFSSIINNVQSDVTIMDFKKALPAMTYISQTEFEVKTIDYFKNIITEIR